MYVKRQCVKILHKNYLMRAMTSVRYIVFKSTGALAFLVQMSVGDTLVRKSNECNHLSVVDINW